MFKISQRLSPLLSPMIAVLFLFSSTVSFIEAARYSGEQMLHMQMQAALKEARLEKMGANLLFDHDTTTKYRPQTSVLIEKEFDKKVTLKSIEIYGKSDYRLTAEYRINGLWSKIDTVISKSFKDIGNGWNHFVVRPINTDAIRLNIIPLQKHMQGIAEIRFKGENGEVLIPKLQNSVLHDKGKQKRAIREYKADKQTVFLSATNFKKDTDSTFRFVVAYHPEQIEKAFLTYDVVGVTGAASVIHAVNDSLAQGGLLVQSVSPVSKKEKSASTSITEEINPSWLKAGINKVRFMPNEAGDLPFGYQISNLRLSLKLRVDRKQSQPKLVVFEPQKGLHYKDFAYIRGFVSGYQGDIVKLTVDGKSIQHALGAFETLAKVRGAKCIKVVATLDNGTQLKQSLTLQTNFSLHKPGSSTVQLSAQGVKLLHGKNTEKKGKLILAKTAKKTEIHFKDAKLNIYPKALQAQRDIKVLSLHKRDLPPLDQGMVNVTKGDIDGYRFLPHGIKFDKKSDLALGYDIHKLPKGKSEKDIKTYFYDENTGRWVALEKVASKEGVVYSKTNHFTDMINAVIKVPDAPQAKGYGATQIKDLKVANPGTKINLIQAPKASLMGDAQLSYPIEIPAGRQGMAPQLRLSYNSGAGNSWVGLGWNLSLPSITIDTRWGVPRYDPVLETETYIFSGQQLSPVAHRSASVTRTAEKTFHPRVEGEFNKIVRHGNNPKSYWWEVTAKNGTRHFYGGTPSTGLQPDAVLTDTQGNIAHWALTMSIDTYGNKVTYTYKKVQHTGVKNGTVPGYNLYIEHINYTGFEETEGAYDIRFERDQARSDIMIDARYGFKKVTADRLTDIKVQYNNRPIRSYKLVYKTGAFEKSLLEKIEQYDANGERFNTHTFAYFDEVRDAQHNYVAFKKEKRWAGESADESSDIGNPANPTVVEPTAPPVVPGDINGDGIVDTLVANLNDLLPVLTDLNSASMLFLDIEQILLHGSGHYGHHEEHHLHYGANASSLLDNIRVWKAPFSGTIAIDAPVALVEDTSQARQNYPDADGVRVSIQHQEKVLWSTQISENDYTQKVPVGVDHIKVKKDDVILFRVQPLNDGAYDTVFWSPAITYLYKDLDTEDANQLPMYRYKIVNDYLQKGESLTIPVSGIVEVAGDINKPPTSDDVTFSLFKHTLSGEKVLLWHQTYPASSSLKGETPEIDELHLIAGETLEAYISSPSNIDFRQVKWQPYIKYYTSKEAFINRILIPDSRYNSPLFPYYRVHSALCSSFGWIAPSTTTVSVRPRIPASLAYKGKILFTVKSKGRLLAKQQINLKDGNALFEKMTLQVKKGEPYFFAYHFSDTITKQEKQGWVPVVTIDGETQKIEAIGLYDLVDEGKQPFYRGWGEYDYDASAHALTEPLGLDTLPIETFRSASDEYTENHNEDEKSADESESLSDDTNHALLSGDKQNWYGSEAKSVPKIKKSLPVYAKGSAAPLAASIPGKASALSGASSQNFTLHSSATVGFFDGDLLSKSSTVGGKVGSSKSESYGTLAMVDIDGDALPDQVIVKDGVLGYKKNLSHDGIEGFDVFKAISGISQFHHSKTSSSNKGLEAHFFAFAGYNKSRSRTTTDIYFSDVNGDGLVDIVSQGSIYYNRLNSIGRPSFSTTSAKTPNPIDESGVLSAGGWSQPQTPAQLAQLEEENPLHDTVRVWIAPEAGKISIDAPVQLIEDTSAKRAAYTKADGVRVAIQHKGIELWHATIAATDYSIKYPSNLNSVSVKAGDRIYFRVQSIFDGAYDSVKWTPIIRYIDKPGGVDANHLPYYTYSAREDFLLSGNSIAMPLDGRVTIRSRFVKPITSDNINLRIVKIDTSGESIIWQQDQGYAAADKTIDLIESVKAGESYRFEITADTNVNWTKIQWNPTVTYTYTSDPSIDIVDSDGNYALVTDVTPTYKPYIKAYQKAAIWTPTTSDNIIITPQLSDINGTGKVVFSVKKDRTLLLKKIYEYQNGHLVTAVLPLSLDVTADEALYFEYHTDTPQLASALATHNDVEVDTGAGYETLHAGVYTYAQGSLFGTMYRHWGQFVYNGNGSRASRPIIESELKLDTPPSQAQDLSAIVSASTPDALENAFAAHGYDPAKSIFIPMLPVSALDAWQGADLETTVTATTITASRFGIDNLLEDVVVPAGNGSTHVRAINQVVETKGKSYALGGSVGPIGGSASRNQQESRTLTQFSDMNGDRYPDIVGVNQVQYTTMLGALESTPIANAIGVPIYNKIDSVAYTLGGTFATGSINTGGQQTIWALSTQDPNAGISGNTGHSTDDQEYKLRDINGDGLPDRLYKDGGVALNLGYSFAPVENWHFGKLQASRSESEGGGVGINIGHYSIGAGFALSTATNAQTHTLIDLNNDGLADEAYIANGVIMARLNTGSGFAAPVAWNGADKLYESKTKSRDKSATFTVCYTPLFVPVKFCVNPGGSKGTGSSHDEAILSDINGDGLLDFLQSTDRSDLRVKESAIGKTNLLKSVERPLGAKIMLDYAHAGNTYNNPHHKWVLSDVKVFDGHVGDGADTMRQHFSYKDGYYDRHEREFYGFAKVTTADIDTENNNTVYRKTIQTFINDNYYEKGLLVNTKVTDGSGRVYVEKINAYETIDIFTGHILTDAEKRADTSVTFAQLVQAQTLYYEGTDNAGQQTALEYTYDKYGNILTQLDLGDFGNPSDNWTATLEYHYDEENYIVSVPKKIEIYDENGDLLRHRETSINKQGSVTEVRIDTGSDTLITNMQYDRYGNLKQIVYPPNYKGERYSLDYTMDDAVQTYVTSVTDSFGYTTSSVYDYRFGIQISQADTNNRLISTTLDAKGRIESITGPLEQGLGMSTIRHSYFPDAAIPYAITQHYDEGRADTIDTVTFIDGLMRVIQTKKDAAIDEDKDGTSIEGMIVSGKVVFDAFGRTVATYYPVSEASGTASAFNPSVDAISPTRVRYDILDRKVLTTLPDGATLFNKYDFGRDRAGIVRFRTESLDANGYKSESFKDVRGRITSVLQHNPRAGQPDIWTSYKYNAVNELVEVSDDHANLTTTRYDLAGRRIEINSPDAGVTSFVYDNAGNMIRKVTSNLRAKGLAIKYTYDYNRLSSIRYPIYTRNNVYYTYGAPGAAFNGAGRITRIEDASGTREFRYGKLGETTQITRTMNAHYHFRDADEEHHEHHKDDEHEAHEYHEDPHAVTYVTKFRYDTWNRLRELTYPDGEVLIHTYDAGGKLFSLEGKKCGRTYPYLKAMTYDKFGQRVFRKYANDTVTRYSYEAPRRRLASLKSQNLKRTFMDNHYIYDAMHNLLGVSNSASVPVVKHHEDEEHEDDTHEKSHVKSDDHDETHEDHEHEPHYLGGETTQSFSYDNLYQLVKASGSWVNNKGETHVYALDMRYDTIGNILSKNQLHLVYEEEEHHDDEADHEKHTQKAGHHDDVREHEHEEGWEVVHKTSYDWIYRYESTQPHAASYIGEAEEEHEADHDDKDEAEHLHGRYFTYDLNGNQLGWLDPEHHEEHDDDDKEHGDDKHEKSSKNDEHDEHNRYGRLIKWDEENRIVSISEHGDFSDYVYDASGERAVKHVGDDDDNVIYYVNAYYVVRDEGEVISKHIFAGSERIATKLLEYEEEEHEHHTYDKDDDHEEEHEEHETCPYEKRQYYYHGDHLGSSSFITDRTGEVYEHIEYFPFGETWVEENDHGYATPYKFTGKEYDARTGLYYYGARYYDPRTSVWQSPDPILNKYLSGAGQTGGVYDPQSLHLYTYTQNNPVNARDPDGEETTGEFLNSWAKRVVYDDVKNDRSGILGAAAVVVASAWDTFGFESLSKVADNAFNGRNDMTTGDYAWATVEVATVGVGKFLKSGKAIAVSKSIPKNIHMGQQGKHIKGHNNYIQGRSTLLDGIDPQKLLDGVHSGSYKIIRKSNRGNPIVNFGQHIGRDGKTGELTQYGQIHSGKKGAHIVPHNKNLVEK